MEHRPSRQIPADHQRRGELDPTRRESIRQFHGQDPTHIRTGERAACILHVFSIK